MYLKAATYQGEPILESITRNTQTIASVAAEAADKGIDILLFAELFLTGYNIAPHRLKQLAIYHDGAEMKEIRCIASKHRIAIAVGYSERVASEEEGHFVVYNSCILIDGTGETVINYRKCHLWDPYQVHERLAFKPGESLPVGDLNLSRSSGVVRIGILICFDCEFPEPARVLALQGAQVLLIPTALAEGPVADSTPTMTVPGRAAENNIFIVYSNLIGSSAIARPPSTGVSDDGDDGEIEKKSHFCGQSGIFGPDGGDLARASKTSTELCCAVLQSDDYENYIRRNNYLHERRPDLYCNMTSTAPALAAQSSHFIHFNAAGDSPMPLCVLQKVKNALQCEHELGGYAAAEEVFERDFARVYELVGELINCSPNNVALVDSATTAWTRAFYSIAFQPGDVILTCPCEYASNYVAILQQAKKTGAVVLVIPSSADGTVSVEGLVEMLEEHRGKVRAVSVTWIPTNGGVVNDAQAIGSAITSHGCGAVYLLDACQAVGQVSVDVQLLQCHVLSATGRKYLRGPRGTGFLYVSPSGLKLLPDPATLDLWSAPFSEHRDSDDAACMYSVATSARRYEQWEKNVAGLLGMGEAVHHLLHTVGTGTFAQISQRACELREELKKNENVVLWDLGSSESKQTRCGIVTFSVTGVEADSVKRGLRNSGIFVSISCPTSTPLDAARRSLPRLVRASVHYFNTVGEIVTFCDALRKIGAGQAQP